MQVIFQPALDFGADRAFGMVGEELASPLDLVSERDVGQRFGMDQVVDNPPFDDGSPRGQLGFQGSGECEAAFVRRV